MRYHRIYKLVDPRYPLDHPEHIRYVGYTSEKLSEQLSQHLSGWPNAGGPRRRWFLDMFQAGTKPEIVIIEKTTSAKEAKERESHWVLYYESQGYELINRELDTRSQEWDRQRVIEDFQIEVMRLLLGEESLYKRVLQELESKGRKGSALYAYLQAAETPNLALREIPALFRERDERVRGLERRVARAIDSGGIQEPIASTLREAIEEGRQPATGEKGSALEHYVEMTEQHGDDHFIFYLGKEPSDRRREKVEKLKEDAREKGWKGHREGEGKSEDEMLTAE